jgi:hypothetical protein
MSAELLLPVLLLAVAAHIFLARWTRSRRRALGIAEGKIVSAGRQADVLGGQRPDHAARANLLTRLDAVSVHQSSAGSARSTV